MGDQARGSCEHLNIIRRWVSTPIGFDVLAEVNAEGRVLAIGYEAADDLPKDERFALHRALHFVIDALIDAEDMAQLAADKLRRLPAGPIADIERAILGEVAALQALRLPAVSFKGKST